MSWSKKLDWIEKEIKNLQKKCICDDKKFSSFFSFLSLQSGFLFAASKRPSNADRRGQRLTQGRLRLREREKKRIPSASSFYPSLREAALRQLLFGCPQKLNFLGTCEKRRKKGTKKILIKDGEKKVDEEVKRGL